MTSAKPKWKKAIAWVSPLLVVSIALHGVAMLLPIPEKVETVEKEPELREPIQISELPELEIPEPEPAPVFVPAPALVEPPQPSQPQPSQPQPLTPQPAPPQPVQPEPQPAPIEPQPQPPDPTPPEDNSPPPATPADNSSQTAPQTGRTPSGPPPNTARNIARDRAAATPQEITDELDAIVKIDDFNAIPSKQIKAPLNLAFPSDGLCLEGDPTEIGSAGVVVFEDNGGTPELITGAILDKTSYKVIGKWLDKTIFLSDQVDPNDPNPVEVPLTPDFDAVQWVSNNYDKPIFEPDETEKAFTFRIAVNISASACED